MSDVVRVPFQGEQLEAVPEGASLWVSILRVCEALGLHVVRQLRKLRAKPWAVTAFKAATAADGKKYRTACIELDSLPMWLATIDAGRVAPAVRPRLLAYQREAAKVLRDHFFGAKRSAPGLTPSDVRALVRDELAALGNHHAKRGSRRALPHPRQLALPNPLEPAITAFVRKQGKREALTLQAILRFVLGRHPEQWELNRAAPIIGPVMRKLGYHNPRTFIGERSSLRRVRAWQPVIVAGGVQ